MTDGYVNEPGFYADDIYPFERYASMVSLSDAIVDTFYHISGQEEGTYYYKVRAKDSQEQWGAWSNVETAVVTGTFVRGDANGDGRISASDVIYLINYLFREGNPPSPLAAGDANSDGQINSSDVVYLLSYLFHGGPPPAR